MVMARSTASRFTMDERVRPREGDLLLGNGVLRQNGRQGGNRGSMESSLLQIPRNLQERLTSSKENIWMRIGALRLALDDKDGALEAYETVLGYSPSNVVAMTQAGALLVKREQYARAAPYLTQAIQADPKYGEAWGVLAHCYVMTHELDNAYEAYKNALNLLSNPRDPNLWYGIGLLYDRYGSLDYALEALLAVLAIAPDFDRVDEVCFCIGIIFKERKEYDKALEYFNHVSKAESPSPPLTRLDALFQIGHVNELKGDVNLAMETYKMVLQENPRHVKTLQRLGWLSLMRNDNEEAYRLLQRASEIDPNDGQSWYLLGRVYAALKQFLPAYNSYQEAVHRDPGNPTYWCSIGVLYYNRAQYKDAMTAYTRAILLDPNLSEVWFDLGTLYEACDQPKDAIEAYRTALDAAPENAQIRARLQKLEHALAGQDSGKPADTARHVELQPLRRSGIESLATANPPNLARGSPLAAGAPAPLLTDTQAGHAVLSPSNFWGGAETGKQEGVAEVREAGTAPTAAEEDAKSSSAMKPHTASSGALEAAHRRLKHGNELAKSAGLSGLKLLQNPPAEGVETSGSALGTTLPPLSVAVGRSAPAKLPKVLSPADEAGSKKRGRNLAEVESRGEGETTGDAVTGRNVDTGPEPKKQLLGAHASGVVKDDHGAGQDVKEKDTPAVDAKDTASETKGVGEDAVTESEGDEDSAEPNDEETDLAKDEEKKAVALENSQGLEPMKERDSLAALAGDKVSLPRIGEAIGASAQLKPLRSLVGHRNEVEEPAKQLRPLADLGKTGTKLPSIGETLDQAKTMDVDTDYSEDDEESEAEDEPETAKIAAMDASKEEEDEKAEKVEAEEEEEVDKIRPVKTSFKPGEDGEEDGMETEDDEDEQEDDENEEGDSADDEPEHDPKEVTKKQKEAKPEGLEDTKKTAEAEVKASETRAVESDEAEPSDDSGKSEKAHVEAKRSIASEAKDEENAAGKSEESEQVTPEAPRAGAAETAETTKEKKNSAAEVQEDESQDEEAAAEEQAPPNDAVDSSEGDEEQPNTDSVEVAKSKEVEGDGVTMDAEATEGPAEKTEKEGADSTKESIPLESATQEGDPGKNVPEQAAEIETQAAEEQKIAAHDVADTAKYRKKKEAEDQSEEEEGEDEEEEEEEGEGEDEEEEEDEDEDRYEEEEEEEYQQGEDEDEEDDDEDMMDIRKLSDRKRRREPVTSPREARREKRGRKPVVESDVGDEEASEEDGQEDDAAKEEVKSKDEPSIDDDGESNNESKSRTGMVDEEEQVPTPEKSVASSSPPQAKQGKETEVGGGQKLKEAEEKEDEEQPPSYEDVGKDKVEGEQEANDAIDEDEGSKEDAESKGDTESKDDAESKDAVGEDEHGASEKVEGRTDDTRRGAEESSAPDVDKDGKKDAETDDPPEDDDKNEDDDDWNEGENRSEEADSEEGETEDGEITD